MENIQRAANATIETYSYKKITVKCKNVNIDSSCIQGIANDRTDTTDLVVQINPNTISVDQRLKEQLADRTPLFVWNTQRGENISACQDARAAIAQQRNPWLHRLLWLGTGALVCSTGGAALPLIGVTTTAIGTTAAIGAAAGAVTGAAVGTHQTHGVATANAQMVRVCNFMEGLNDIWNRIGQISARESADLLVEQAKRADEIGGSAAVVMEECIRYLQAMSSHTSAIAEEYGRIRRIDAIQKGISYHG